jgi:site-specific DNA-methyltransferase (adenine-specific)
MTTKALPNNQVLLGDCLALLEALPSESISLIYLDPPFFTQKKHSLKSRDTKTQYEFEDSWKSLDHYISFMRERLLEMKRVLKPNGSLFLHCDTYASHHLRVLLDEIFGVGNFRSEIIWTYKRWTNAAKGLIPAHQTIYYYSKSNAYTFNTLFGAYSETTNVDQILQLRQRDKDGVTKYLTNEEGEIQFSDKKAGVPLGDTWEIPFLNPKAKERVGYPTQKPLLLLERIVELASNPNEIVLDPFCGSGTTLVAAKLLGRNFIGFDRSQDAVDLANARILNPIKTDSQLLKKGRESYINADSVALGHLLGLEFHPVQRNKGIDAFLSGQDSKENIPVKVQKENESIIDCIHLLEKAVKGKGITKGFIIRTQPEVSLIDDYECPSWIKIVDSVKFQIGN